MQVERGREAYQDGGEAGPCLMLLTGQVRRAMSAASLVTSTRTLSGRGGVESRSRQVQRESIGVRAQATAKGAVPGPRRKADQPGRVSGLQPSGLGNRAELLAPAGETEVQKIQTKKKRKVQNMDLEHLMGRRTSAWGHSPARLRAARLIPGGSIGGEGTWPASLGGDRAGQDGAGMGPAREGLRLPTAEQDSDSDRTLQRPRMLFKTTELWAQPLRIAICPS